MCHGIDFCLYNLGAIDFSGRVFAVNEVRAAGLCLRWDYMKGQLPCW